VADVKDVVDFNVQDSLVRIPYGQARFYGILADSTSAEELIQIKTRLNSIGSSYFDTPMKKYQLDAVLSINNYDAGVAAVAKYPALTIPMGYKETGEPVNLTFIVKPFQERTLYEFGAAFEALTQARKMPGNYVN
jgi:amidase